jgi:hypothetical protein
LEAHQIVLHIDFRDRFIGKADRNICRVGELIPFQSFAEPEEADAGQGTHLEAAARIATRQIHEVDFDVVEFIVAGQTHSMCVVEPQARIVGVNKSHQAVVLHRAKLICRIGDARLAIETPHTVVNRFDTELTPGTARRARVARIAARTAAEPIADAGIDTAAPVGAREGNKLIGEIRLIESGPGFIRRVAPHGEAADIGIPVIAATVARGDAI